LPAPEVPLAHDLKLHVSVQRMNGAPSSNLDR